MLTALWGTLSQLAISPFSWMDAAMEGVGERVGEMMETEAWRISGGSIHGGPMEEAGKASLPP